MFADLISEGMWKEEVPNDYNVTGADPGFFVGGGAPPRNGLTDW